MVATPPVPFLARHFNELHGLRTALLGVMLLLWGVLYAWTSWQDTNLWSGALLVTVLLVWHLDDRLANYYEARVGIVRPLHPMARIGALLAVGTASLLLFAVQQDQQLQLALWTVPIAMLHLHIGLVGGPYRRQYVIGAITWLAFVFLPMVPLGEVSQRTLGFLAAGGVTVFVGSVDHWQLMRGMARNGDGNA